MRRLTALFVAVGLLGMAATPASGPEHTGLIVNDVSRLNPIPVRDIIVPTSIEEVITAVRSHDGPVSIGGGRYSMGGQTATDGAVQIDMRRMDKVVGFSRDAREITVQAGITWRKLQEYIDPYGLSVRIMQTYDNFTVGGSLSVNVHGRYMGEGPLVKSVKSIRMVLADGSVVTASPTQNPQLFYGAIGGYGSLGVIVEATLGLSDDGHVERRSRVMQLSEYFAYFRAQVRNDPAVVFHNADIYPDAYDTVRATSFVKTELPVTVPDRMGPQRAAYRLDHAVLSIVATWPGGKWIRQHIVEPLMYHHRRVEWRNYEASLDLRQIDPPSSGNSTYVLQEYFTPVDRVDGFVPEMGVILNRHHVNVINVSIRHAPADPGTLLAWAPTEVFAFVLYYRQDVSEAQKQAAGVWTRELIDAALSHGGSWYLPYQIAATPSQFRQAYPRAAELWALKARVDPGNKFRNRLLDAYFEPPSTSAGRD